MSEAYKCKNRHQSAYKSRTKSILQERRKLQNQSTKSTEKSLSEEVKKSDWIYTVLANRKQVHEFNTLPLSQRILNSLKKYDVIIGAIADDRMNEAMQRFSDYGLTDQGLIACLQSVDYGYQVVAKTEYACSKIEILDEKKYMVTKLNS